MNPLGWMRGLVARRRTGGPSRLSDAGSGFTMVEMVTVAVVMGTLVRIAMPDLQDVLMKARAAEVVGDFETVRVAVMSYHADHLAWPDDGYTGMVPTGLEPYLPANFSFEGQGYRLDWENWALPDGLPRDPDARALLGISVITDDRALGLAVADLLGPSMGQYALGDQYTFVVDRE